MQHISHYNIYILIQHTHDVHNPIDQLLHDAHQITQILQQYFKNHVKYRDKYEIR